jgi:hypothetical protein
MSRLIAGRPSVAVDHHSNVDDAGTNLKPPCVPDIAIGEAQDARNLDP